VKTTDDEYIQTHGPLVDDRANKWFEMATGEDFAETKRRVMMAEKARE